MHSDPGCTDGGGRETAWEPAAVRTAMLARIESPTGVENVALARALGRVLAGAQAGLVDGHRLRVTDIGLVAAGGCAEVRAYRRPRVAVLCTGDELCPVGHALAPGQIHDSNRYLLAGLLAKCGVDVVDLGVAPDRVDSLRRCMARAAADCDAIVTTGGASAGEADLLCDVIAADGELLIRRVAMRPGRPMAFGRIDRAWIFSLAGKPSGVLAVFLNLVADALRRLGGERLPPAWPRLPATLAEPLTKNHRRSEFVQGILFERGGRWMVHASRDEAGRLGSMSAANCYIVMSPAEMLLAAGQRVPVQFFGGRC